MRAAVLVLGILALSGCLGSGSGFGGGGFDRCAGDGWPAWASGRSLALLCQDGRARTAVLHVPDAAAGVEAVPLLLMLHGGGGNADQFRQASGMDAVADELGFAVLYADGTPARRAEQVRTWNAMACCGRAYERQTDDVAFLGRLLDGALARYPIDAARVGVAGHSNGAMMAYRLAAERSDVVTAAMPVAGAIGGQLDAASPVAVIAEPAEPVSVLVIHARDDDHVPYEGGHGGAAVDGPRIDLSVAQALEFWMEADGITGPASPDHSERPEGIRQDWFGPGDRGTRVSLIATEGGHGWPGGTGGLGPAPRVPDASFAIGEFLWGSPRAPATNP